MSREQVSYRKYPPPMSYLRSQQTHAGCTDTCVHLYIDSSRYIEIYLSICLSVFLFYLSICLSAYLSICLSIVSWAKEGLWGGQ